MLTEQQKAYYMRKGSCPYCLGAQVEAGDIDGNDNFLSQKMLCLECNKNWNDIFQLIDIDENQEGL